jgi:hypothetical protein
LEKAAIHWKQQYEVEAERVKQFADDNIRLRKWLTKSG